MNARVLRAAQSALFLLSLSMTMPAQDPKPGVIKPLPEVKFAQDDDVKCLASAAENGDPAKGASTFILKAPPGCLVPWHYHTAQEQLIVTSGLVLTEMGSMPSRALGPGGFAMMPSKEKHQFSCKSKSSCVMFVTFDRAYDIFWVHESQSSKKISK